MQSTRTLENGIYRALSNEQARCILLRLHDGEAVSVSDFRNQIEITQNVVPMLTDMELVVEVEGVILPGPEWERAQPYIEGIPRNNFPR